MTALPRSEWLGSVRTRAVLVAALVATGLLVVLSRGVPWVGSWKMALDWGAFSVMLIGPAAAGIACTVYVRFRRSEVPELLAQAARPWVGWTAPAVGVWLLASLAVLLICAFTTVGAWAAGAKGYPTLYWVALPALAVLAAEVALGSLLGSLTGQYWAAPWAAVGVFGLHILTGIGVIPGLFRTGGVSGALAGETFDARTLLLQGIATAGIAAGALAASRWELFRCSTVGYRGLTVVCVGAATLAYPQVGSNDDRYVPTAVGLECRSGRPTVCMSEDASRPLDDLAAEMQRLARPLYTAGATLPERFVSEHPGQRAEQGDGSLRLYSEEELSDDVSVTAAAESLALPADCPAYSSDDPRELPDTWFTVTDVLVRWILVQDGEEPEPSGDHPLAGWWALPVERQYPWVRTTYEALRDCRLHDLRLPR